MSDPKPDMQPFGCARSRSAARLSLRLPSASRTRREVVRVKGEVLEPYPHVDVPVPGELEAWTHPIGPTVIYVPQPAPVAEPEPQKPSRTIPWALIAVAACILVYACFAAWHTWVGPQLDPVRKHPVDLVGPHR